MILSTEKKNNVLKDLASLIQDYSADIISANKKDLELANDLDPTLVDRLKVDEKKVKGMVASVAEVLELEDPEGKILSAYNHPNGMLVENKVVPFGKILIIYESRPDVTIEAAVSAFKSGNKILLKGGKEARFSNLALVELWKKALEMNNVSTDYVEYLDIDRATTQKLLAENTHNLDLIIPRGGEGLINYIKQTTNVPLMISGRGNNFIYIHENADFDMAVDIVLNGKSRLSVCNALDKVLLSKDLPNLEEKVQQLAAKAVEFGLEVVGDDKIAKFSNQITAVDSESLMPEEFLSERILFSVTESLEEAISTINKYSGGHSAVIVSTDKESATAFQYNVDCAAVYHNASSRFTDGGQFGFGAEIAISTQKLHFRGPVGLAQLVTNKWFISGNGQTRN
ncbi:glutamate-5-semialdehyde dehydrogenase [Flammeovirga agarivorans]|uniref:Gamma-glutamyl phosphate reductase n=1 Tax=Flammeovirga agarivorans TaxID=2726742 RepID=A0A7X8SPI6_9BACT|nr:glutamate-5-semialdehyde dehydrogenase [Flammeovirga agarivorans]NLR94018.1 glutamate-5-semialdehyde dehydrogenase [Flammeovirga agarivorans]